MVNQYGLQSRQLKKANAYTCNQRTEERKSRCELQERQAMCHFREMQIRRNSRQSPTVLFTYQAINESSCLTEVFMDSNEVLQDPYEGMERVVLTCTHRLVMTLSLNTGPDL